VKLRLAQIAHARSGDKADIADISLFAWEPMGYAVLTKHVTVAVVQKHFAHVWPEHAAASDANLTVNSDLKSGVESFSESTLATGSVPTASQVTRYELPNLLALKFVLRGALNGGAASSLRSDNLGKTLGAQLLRLTIDVPDKEAQPVLQATEKVLADF
jgi:hypothetical protein